MTMKHKYKTKCIIKMTGAECRDIRRVLTFIGEHEIRKALEDANSDYTEKNIQNSIDTIQELWEACCGVTK
jgi:hypothetical protein